MHNLLSNRTDAVISDADMADIQSQIADITQRLPFLVGLTDQERKRLSSIRHGKKLFVEAVIRSFEDNQHVMLGYIDTESIRKDFELFQQLTDLELMVGQLQEKLSHTRMLAGSEAFQGSLVFYHSLKRAARSGLPGIQTVLDELKPHFDGQRKGGHFSPEEAPAPQSEPQPVQENPDVS